MFVKHLAWCLALGTQYIRALSIIMNGYRTLCQFNPLNFSDRSEVLSPLLQIRPREADEGEGGCHPAFALVLVTFSISCSQVTRPYSCLPEALPSHQQPFFEGEGVKNARKKQDLCLNQ